MFAKLTVIGGESEEELARALGQRRVLIIKGKDFHLSGEERGWMRINYAVGIDKLREGLRRIERYLVEKVREIENSGAAETSENTEGEAIE